MYLSYIATFYSFNTTANKIVSDEDLTFLFSPKLLFTGVSTYSYVRTYIEMFNKNIYQNIPYIYVAQKSDGGKL